MSFSSLPYITNIPNPPNAPSVDVPNMQTDTNSIQTYLQRDHVSFANAFAGAHLQLNLQETTTSGTPTLPSLLAGNGFGTLYATTNSSQIGGNRGEIYYTPGATGTQIQLTGPLNPTPSAAPATNQSSNGYTFIPGGILIQFGQTSNFSGSSLTCSFPVAFRNALSISIAGTSTNSAFAITSFSTSGFTAATVGGSTSHSSVYWIAIGN